ncbi:NAD(P)-dependent dehydrogenase, short-chain alcohol dehydrogenase family [Catalinimonas alkaloidigena]|uniref:NAD(P)-dependent dehydrogenase, short-chain alcohol dehydrogenase family n=1 Tax=Catalinimonas alkaloidigena TaxID=1075417 RepID=A0A1G9HBB3_9BACT|nr:SDR family oxidoreductase [Catalinimonas alkaloidigena]SDL10217.1 NAD(P)-dependent dehydrogenase, short-chain alcohol dehydrogenase family [Catalinimonas alkaloidigena]
MNLQLQGKTALVTGSTAGIGYAIAKLLAAEGASVIITGRTQERIDQAIAAIQQDHAAATLSGVPVDFSQTAQVQALLQQVPDVDILVNNVGIFEPKPFAEIPDEDWLRFFEMNVMSGIRLSRHYFPKMLAQNWGRIIFISSESAIHIPEEMIHYGMTKTAQLAVSRGLAELTKGTRVTVNTVLPGPTKSEGVTEFLNQLSQQQQKSKAEVEEEFFNTARPTSLIRRFAHVDEVANLVAYVASPLSSATNGAALRADGGLVKSII